MPVITRSSARSAWERSKESSGIGGLETSALESISISFRSSALGSGIIVSLSSSVLDQSQLSICTAARTVGNAKAEVPIQFLSGARLTWVLVDST